MTPETVQQRLTHYQQQLEQQIARRTQLTELLGQTDENVKRLEGACGVLRELLEPTPTAEPIGTNGSDPTEPAV